MTPQIGQRWIWKSESHFIVEIISGGPKYFDCKVVQYFSGDYRIGAIHNWTISNSYWQYLIGQDKSI